MSFRERASKLYMGVPVHFLLRDYLTPLEKESSRLNNPQSLRGGALFVNGRALFLKGASIPLEGDERAYLCGDELVAFRLSGSIRHFNLEPPLGARVLSQLKEALPSEEVAASVVRYPWELVNLSSSAIASDFELLEEKGIEGHLDPGAEIVGDERSLRVGKGSRVEPCVLLNVEKGPICIGEDVLIRGPSAIDGPCFIGDRLSLIHI